MDEFQSYQCVTKHILSQETSTSSVAGRLMVNDPRSSVPPRITDSRSTLRAPVGATVELLCAAQGYPIPQYRWYRITGGKKQDHQIKEINPSGRIRQVGGSLLIQQVLPLDAGKYVCVVSSTVGEERTHTTLDVWAPLSAHIAPQMQTVDVGGKASFNCSTEGFPLDNITWLKDGSPLQLDNRIRLLSTRRVLIDRVNRHDRGMYQCVIYNNNDSAQGSAQLKLGDASPQWLNTSGPQVVSPGAKVTLECHVQGSPPPNLFWTLRGQVVDAEDKNAIVENEILRETVVGRLHIPSVRVEDGGVWSCSASNRAGTIVFKERLNVRGPPSIRAMSPRTVVAGQPTSFDCIVVGYPIDFIFWEKNGVVLPVSSRQAVYPNGTLKVTEVSKESDSGTYACVATAGELSVRSELKVTVLVPPEIDRRLFSWGAGYPVGSPARVMCVVVGGDLPLKFTWTHESKILTPNNDLSVRYLDDQTSVLLFHSLEESNAGNYSCTASNQVASDTAWASLLVKVAPTWEEEPEDISVVVGATVKLPCNARGAPTPKSTWKRAQGGVPRQYVPINTIGDNIRISKENRSLIIREIRRDQGGELLCIASNGVGSDLSKAVKIVVKVPPQFEAKEENVTITAGNTATLSCLALGNLPIEIKWLRGSPGEELPESDLRDREKYALANTVINSSQQNFPSKMTLLPPSLKYYNGLQSEGRGLSSSIKVPTTTRDDSIVFTCLASNVYGNDTKTINLIVQEVPMPVASPKVTNTGSRSISLSWNGPSHDGNSPINSYRVLIINNTDSWMNVGHIRRFEVSSTSVTIGGLKPAHSYLLRILATNGVGTSPPSNELRITTVHEPPTIPPTKVRAAPLSPTSLKITWKMPDIPSSQLASFGYYVGYKLLNSTDPVRYETKHPSTVSLYRQEAILTNLRKFSAYLITVQGFNKAGAGPKSSPVIATTDEDVPDEAPNDIFCSSLTSSSILVKWKPPNPAFINGVLGGYEIFYEISDKFQKQSVVGTSATIRGLTPYTNYSVSLAAFTRVGTGVKSDPIFCLTDEDIPGPVTRLKGLSGSKSGILVSWMPPDQPNGIILKYSLTMKRHQPLSSFSTIQSDDWFLPFPASHSVVDSSLLKFKTNNNDDNNNDNDNDNNNDNHNNNDIHDTNRHLTTNALERESRVWDHERRSTERSWIIPGHEEEYLVGGLNERASYSFNVRASTVVGEGPPGSSVTQKPRHDPPAAISSFSREMLVFWGEEVKLPCRVVGTPPPNRHWTLNGKELGHVSREGSPLPQELSDGTLLFKKAKLSDEANYTCSVANDHGKDQITYTIKIRASKGKGLPPPSPLIYISDVSTSKISLRWKIPDMGQDSILGYKIFIKREYGDWKQIEVESNLDEYQIEDLDCGVRYQVYMVAVNKLGTSEPSDVIATRTLGREPVAPSRSSFLMENATSLMLQFSSWEDGGCPITSFVIEYQMNGLDTWRMVSNYVRRNESPIYIIKNLHPETSYLLRVTAHNSAGSSIAKFPFSTHLYGSGGLADDLESNSEWLHGTHILLAIVAACLLVLGSITVAILFGRRKLLAGNEDENKNKGQEMVVRESLTPMNGNAALIRRKSMNILEAYVPSSELPSGHPEAAEIPTYYTFEMDAPPPSPIQSIKDGTLSGSSIYSYRSRRKNSTTDYATISSKTSPEKMYTFSNC